MKTRFALLCLVTACGSGGGSTDIESTLRFSDLTDTQISRLVSAASGSEGFEAQYTLSSFDPSGETNPDPCPAISVNGKTVTITGGCTTRDKARIEGSGSITNALGWGDGEIEIDEGEDSAYDMTGFAIVQAGQRRGYDGSFIIGGGRNDMNLTTDVLGVQVRSDVFMDCSGAGCSLGGSGVELVGVGGAKVSGTALIAGQTATTTYTLEGVDTVTVTMKNTCVSWVLEGTDRKFDSCNR